MWWPALEHLDSFHDAPIPEPGTLFDDYEGRGAAAQGHEAFLPWYDDAYRRQRDEYMNDDQRAAFDGVYGPINADFRDAAYYHYYEYPGIHAVKRHYGIRTDRYKLIHFYHDVDEWELYDLDTDPEELRNVYADPEYREIREELTRKLGEVQSRYGDSSELARQLLESDLASAP